MQFQEVDLPAEEEQRLDELHPGLLYPEGDEPTPEETLTWDVQKPLEGTDEAPESPYAPPGAYDPDLDVPSATGPGNTSAEAEPYETETDEPYQADETDHLSGQALQRACEDAGIDTSTGGSLADGSMSADEKRAALKAARTEE